jgi:hypothetical protein
MASLALARSPGDRYESAVAMLKDVRRVMAGEPPRLEASGATGGSFDGIFLLIGEFRTTCGKEFDAVIGHRVVTC